MKILNPIQVELFLNILDKKHTQKIIHFTESSHLLTKKLHHFCQENNIQYALYCAKDIFYDKSKTKYSHDPHIDIVKFDLHSSDWMLQETKYDYLIVTLDLKKEDKRHFLDKSYLTLQKEGSMIVITPKSDVNALVQWQSLLNEKHYATVNTFHTMLDNYDVMIVKSV